MNNRKHNSHNPNQGNFKKVLCVCSAGLLRSPTLAHVLAVENGYNTRACGTSPDFALVILDEVLLEWADEVVFVNMEVYNYAYYSFREALLDMPLKVLDIPDIFPYRDPTLMSICLEQYNKAEDSCAI